MTKHRFNATQETRLAILKAQRSLALMNLPHSYRLVDVASLLSTAAAAGDQATSSGDGPELPDIFGCNKS